MKSNNMFREQVNTVSNWFKSWSDCEQTVALYSLLKRLSPTQVKFIAQVLEQGAAENSQVQKLEEEANSSDYISKLSTEPKETAVTQLLSHLPLLRTGNAEAKTAYLKLIPQVLSYSIDNGVHIEESRQLLSFSLIHPAITCEERSQFTMWLGYLEERFNYSIYQNRQNNFQSQCNFPNREESLRHPQHVITHLNLANKSCVNGWNERSAASDAMQKLTLDGNSTERLIPLNYSKPGATQNNNANSNNADRSSQSHTVQGKLTGHAPLHTTSSAPPNISSVPGGQSDNLLNWLGIDTCKSLQELSMEHKDGGGIKPHSPVKRTISVISPSNISDMLIKYDDPGCRVRPMSQTSDHAPSSPRDSITSSGSGSDSHLDEGGQPIRNSFTEGGSGMKDVPTWLKSLRLHKYSHLFQQLSYKEMMELSEPWLEAQNVTKGARHKIVLSIKKLKERQELIRTLEKNIISGHPIKAALTELKNILNTPMKACSPSYATKDDGTIQKPGLLPSSPPSVTDVEATAIPEGDLPGQFTRIMGKASTAQQDGRPATKKASSTGQGKSVCTQLLVCNRTDEECHNMYLQLIDKCLNHEAFTVKQRKLLTFWKQQVPKPYHAAQHKYGLDSKSKNWVQTIPQVGTNFGSRSGAARITRKPPKTAAGLPQWCFGSKRSSVVGGSTSGGHLALSRKNSYSGNMISQSCLLEQPSKLVLTQSQSMPLRPSQIGLVSSSRPGSESNNDPEITAQLDSLCLSMTEIALGGMHDPSSSGGQWTDLQQNLQSHARVPPSPPPPPPTPPTQLE